jgi:hypothetical protein
MTAYDKCSYSSYARTHGGTADECRALAADNARARLNGNIDPYLLTN